jgi:hypothetical protein
MTRRLLLAAGLAAAAAGTLLLPWWRADRVPVLLVAGPSRALPVDAWTGAELAGPPRTALVAVLAILALAPAAG